MDVDQYNPVTWIQLHAYPRNLEHKDGLEKRILSNKYFKSEHVSLCLDFLFVVIMHVLFYVLEINYIGFLLF